jgi:DNA-binding transcriptional MerR regulator
VTTLRIAEVAERTGVPATTLRYYEDIGLLAPAERSGNGYRAYSERDVERLRFITRAKQLDISLDDLRELVTAWDGENCEGVQGRMAEVVSARLREAQDRLAELVELTGALRSAVARLSSPPQPGACDDGCACSTAHQAGGPAMLPLTDGAARTALPLTTVAAPPPAPSSAPPLECTLDPGATRRRIGDWQAVLARGTSRSPVPGGWAVTFDADPQLAADLARLVAAEHACCSFLDFAISVTGDGMRFEVRAPGEARDLLSAVFGPVGQAR